LSGRHLMASG